MGRWILNQRVGGYQYIYKLLNMYLPTIYSLLSFHEGMTGSQGVKVHLAFAE